MFRTEIEVPIGDSVTLIVANGKRVKIHVSGLVGSHDVKLAIDAPRAIPINRSEIQHRVDRSRRKR